mmetsp:Transcript_6646/g.11598  ORF Transcript_6646/g.11598 Transcript_6646/m.11598 type:complete len:583 (-) Transcript_6646:43-1791(-)
MDEPATAVESLAIVPVPEEDEIGVAGEESQQPTALRAFRGDGAECAICFAPLPSEPVCVLIRHAKGKKRSCRHYFHLGCAHLLQRTTPAPHSCPLCRTTFERCMQLPDVRLDSRAWFDAVDADDGQALEKAEVVDALAATLPVDPERLSASLEGELWEQWDPNKTGRITLQEFENPARGLLQFVLYSLPSLRTEAGGNSRLAVPDLVVSRESWFRYWDEKAEHALSFQQCLRALVMTWRLEGAKEDAGVVRTVLSGVFAEFGLSNEDGPVRSVTLKLFCEKPDGFCDALIAALKSAFGAVKFNRMRQRALLIQRPALELKRKLVRIRPEARDIIDKQELVEALLDVEELNEKERERENTENSELAAGAVLSTPTTAPQPKKATAAIKAASIKELKLRLKLLGVPCDHCLERGDLEELLAEAEEEKGSKRPLEDGISNDGLFIFKPRPPPTPTRAPETNEEHEPRAETPVVSPVVMPAVNMVTADEASAPEGPANTSVSNTGPQPQIIGNHGGNPFSAPSAPTTSNGTSPPLRVDINATQRIEISVDPAPVNEHIGAVTTAEEHLDAAADVKKKRCMGMCAVQ